MRTVFVFQASGANRAEKYPEAWDSHIQVCLMFSHCPSSYRPPWSQGRKTTDSCEVNYLSWENKGSFIFKHFHMTVLRSTNNIYFYVTAMINFLSPGCLRAGSRPRTGITLWTAQETKPTYRAVTWDIRCYPTTRVDRESRWWWAACQAEPSLLHHYLATGKPSDKR